ncbi:MAG TPA: ISAs1 family transposase [Nostoc sp.]|uniref:ISAs1 family transposase n=1 Tax=Nostoc sp. TaxID=1180 RepID=UPI002D70F458|nr:ISAs1 family transposase [Nostoc sp.]HYX15148.1 ISAs1 family transposase [Nostoc sp.]
MRIYSPMIEKQMQSYYESLSEKDRRRYAAIEAKKLGYGGMRYISKLFRCNYRTISKGIADLEQQSLISSPRIRRQGAGRKKALETISGINEAFVAVIESHTAGSPMDEGTQTAIASQIFYAKADYILSLKGNHPTLHGQVKDWFEQHLSQGFESIIHSYQQRVDKGHHRTEKRQVWCVPISQLPTLHNQDDWVGLKCVVMVMRVPCLWNKTTREVQFYLTSLDCDACKLGQAIRLHWGVENGLHWTMDVTFHEDACRVRTGHPPQNLALLRRIALNALNLEPSFKRTNHQKSNRAAMDNNYMLTILAACLSQHNDTFKPACQ